MAEVRNIEILDNITKDNIIIRNNKHIYIDGKYNLPFKGVIDTKSREFQYKYSKQILDNDFLSSQNWFNSLTFMFIISCRERVP